MWATFVNLFHTHTQESNLHITEPQETEYSFRYRQVHFHTGTLTHLNAKIKSHLLFAGIISSQFSPR